MTRFSKIKDRLKQEPRIWLITGVSGFIGSNLLEFLLKIDQRIIGLDNFSTGFQKNLDEVKSLVSPTQWNRFRFIEGDITNYNTCEKAVRGVDYVLHQAALGSVPRSLADPLTTNSVNVGGFLNMLHAAMCEDVTSFTYASSSSTYGDIPALPKQEDQIGKPLSPYAVSKYVNELYADVYFRSFGFNSIGLRYFNVFGNRQNPNSAYSAVIPLWTRAMIEGEPVFINGDGASSRDFCHISNTIQMNILAATAKESALNQIYNVALGDRTSLNDLYEIIKNSLEECGVKVKSKVINREFRNGDVRHSEANIKKSISKLGYAPQCRIVDGIRASIPWYIEYDGH